MTLVDQCVKRVTSRGGNVGLLFSGFDYTGIAAISVTIDYISVDNPRGPFVAVVDLMRS
jgi:hypothetical protein